MLWTDISNPNDVKAINEYSSDPKDKQSILVIEPFTSTIDTTYTVQIEINILGGIGLKSS